MIRFIRKNKTWMMVLAFFMCLVFAIIMTKQITVSAAGTGTATNYSFAVAAKAAAQYFGYSQSPDGHGLEGFQASILDTSSSPTSGYTTGTFQFSHMGGLVGFQPPEDVDRDSNFMIAASDSLNVVSYSMTALSHIDIDSASVCSGGSIQALSRFDYYAQYGYALSQLGFDETCVGTENNSMRMLLGGLMLVAYLLSLGLSAFFTLLFDLLNFANPLRLFMGPGSVIVTEILDDYNIQPTDVVTGPLDFSTATVSDAIKAGVSDIVIKLTGLYNNLYSLSWSTIIPLFFVVALFTWLVVKQGSGQQKSMGGTFIDSFKKLGIRMVFATLGIPLLLACYTTALGFVDTFCARTTVTGSSIILHTFVDFENWVYANRLALPESSEILIKINDGSVYANPSGSRNLCARINASIGQGYPATAYSNATDYLYAHGLNPTASGAYSELAYERTVLSDLKNDNRTTVSFYEGTAVDSTYNYNIDSISDDMRLIVNLLERYMRGDIVTSSSFQSKRLYQLSTSGTWADAAVLTMFNESINYRNFDSKKAGDFDYQTDTGTITVHRDQADVEESVHSRFSVKEWEVDAQKCVNIWNDGSGFAYTVESTGDDFGGSLYGSYQDVGSTYRGLSFMSNQSPASNGSGHDGLSTMSMYNYLSSEFTKDSVFVYSADYSSTNQSKIGHYSVNAIGGGIMTVINIVNALVLLASISVIGYGYGFSLMMSNFKAMFKIIMPVFSGMLGFMSGIASTVILVCAMIINILATCILYSVAVDIMYAIYNLVEFPLVIIFGRLGHSGGAQFVSLIITPLLGVLSIVLIVTIVKQLLRLRTAVVKSATEVTTAAINKFLATAVAAPNLDASGATAAQKLINAAGVGTSLAMGAMATSNGDGTNFIKDKLSSFGEKLGLGAESEDAEGTAGDGTNGANGEDGSMGAFGVKTGNGTGETPGVDEKSSGTKTETDTAVLNKTNAEGRKPGMSAGGDDRGVNTEEQAQAYLDNKSGAVDTLSGNDKSDEQQSDNNNAASGDGKVSLAKSDDKSNSTSNGTTTDTASGNDKVSLDKNGKSSKLVGDDALSDNNNSTEDSRDSDTEANGADKTETRSGTLTEKLRLDKNTETEIADGNNADNLSADSQVEGTKFANMNARPNANGTANNGTEAFVDGTTGDSSDSTTNTQNPTAKFVGDNSTANSQLTADSLAGGAQSGGYYIDGNTNEPYQVICDKTGKSYTAADQASGLSYSVLGVNGKPLTDASGTTYAGMVAGTVQFGAGGQIQSMVNPLNGATTAFTPAPAASGGSFGGGSGSAGNNATPIIIAGTMGGLASNVPAFTAGLNNNTVTTAPAQAPAYAAPASNGAAAPVYAASDGSNNSNVQAGPVYVQGTQTAPNSGITQSGAVNIAVDTSNGGLASAASGGTSDSSHSDTVINQQISNGAGGSGGGPVYVNTMGGGSEGPSVQTVDVGGGISYVDSDAQPAVAPVAPAAAPASAQETSVQSAPQEPVVIVDKSDSNNNSSDDNNSSDNGEDKGESGIARAFSGIANAVASTLKENHSKRNDKK